MASKPVPVEHRGKIEGIFIDSTERLIFRRVPCEDKQLQRDYWRFSKPSVECDGCHATVVCNALKCSLCFTNIPPRSCPRCKYDLNLFRMGGFSGDCFNMACLGPLDKQGRCSLCVYYKGTERPRLMVTEKFPTKVPNTTDPCRLPKDWWLEEGDVDWLNSGGRLVPSGEADGAISVGAVGKFQ